MKKAEKWFLILLCLIILKIALISFYAGAEMHTSGATREETSTSDCAEELKLALIKEKEKLEKEKAALLAKKEELSFTEKKIEEQMTALRELIKNAEAKLQELKAIQDERFKLLIKTYSEMRPAKAAQLLMNMDKEMAVKILSQLKSSQVASILSSMPPDKAASLAEAMTGYPPKEY